jgi:hypothetical protein
VVHGLASSTGGAVPARHVPAWQSSAPLQTVASAHEAPSGLSGFEHTPVVGLQVPASWQASRATQVTAVPETHSPVALHVSAPLHALPSAQLVPAATGVWLTPVEASQLSVVQALPSSRLGAVPAVQAPD